MSGSAKKRDKAQGAVASNRRARHDFDIEQTYEAGIVLVGSEVKTLRDGKASLADSYATIKRGEMFLHNLHIPEYPQASIQNHEPTRVRKLLLHKAEIAKLKQKIEAQGYTLVPLKLYFNGNKVKVEVALAKGRKTHDKRQAIAKRDAERDMQKASAAMRRR